MKPSTTGRKKEGVGEEMREMKGKRRPPRKCLPIGQCHTNPGARQRGTQPGWEVDFTEIKPGKIGCKYLLIFIDTFSGWIEAYPTKNKMANMVVKKLIEEILYKCGFLAMIGSDNDPAFRSQVLAR